MTKSQSSKSNSERSSNGILKSKSTAHSIGHSISHKFNEFINHFDRFLHVDQRLQDPEELVSIRFYQFTTLIIFFVFIGFAMGYVVMGSYHIAAVQALISIGSCLSLFVYRKTKSMAWTGSFIMFFASLSGLFRAYSMGGISSPAFYIWPLIPVFCGLLMPVRWAALWTSVYVAIAIYFHSAYLQGQVFTSQLTEEKIATVRILTIVVVEFFLLIGVYNMKKINSKFRKLVQQKKEDKTNLVRVLTHDLATPFMSMSLDLAILQKKHPSPEVDKMTRALNICISIVQQVRRMEALESHKVALEKESVNLKEVIQEIEFLHKESMQSKKISFQISSSPEDETFFVMADKTALSYQVFNNLISNAIKFTEPGGRIDIVMQKAKRHIIVEINDTGIGMPVHLIPLLFYPSKETTRTGTQGEKGTGFGMPIVSSYLKHFNADIEVTSREKKGSEADHGTQIKMTFPRTDGDQR